jgi:sugar phosphate isomerase/epimerase
MFANQSMNRRDALSVLGGVTGAAVLGPNVFAAPKPFAFNYTLASAMYGTAPLSEILPEAKKTGARSVTIWPVPHGDQREQIESMGHDAFIALMRKHKQRLGAIACYKLGPFGMRDEMRFARKIAGALGQKQEVVMITGGKGPRDLMGAALKAAVLEFAEKLKPEAAFAAEHNCAIAIENHGNNLFDSPDSMRWFADAIDTANLGIAFAPHHLVPAYMPENGQALGKLAGDLGPAMRYVYAQQYGHGFRGEGTIEDVMMQMPGRGALDFGPLTRALAKINFTGLTEILMHPTPRGIPIRDTTPQVTKEINMARRYLNGLVSA